MLHKQIMTNILEKLGQDPKRNMALFIKGIGLFVVGIILIFLGYYQHHVWQIIGIVFLALGGAISAWAYIRLFANRLYQIFNRPPPSDKF